MAFSVLTVLVGLLFMSGGSAKLAGVAVMRRDAERFGFSYGAYRLIGAAEFAGGLAVCAALFARQPLLGIVGAAGLTLLMLGAVVVHVKVKDAVAKAIPAVVFGVLATIIAYFFAMG